MIKKVLYWFDIDDGTCAYCAQRGKKSLKTITSHCEIVKSKNKHTKNDKNYVAIIEQLTNLINGLCYKNHKLCPESQEKMAEVIRLTGLIKYMNKSKICGGFEQ